MLKLIIEDDEGRKTVVPFVRDEITIGRQEGNTIRLTERNVSRRHARLMRQNGHVLIEDLGSYNGIRVNGDRIQGQVKVEDGDLIQIGDYDLAVQREEERTQVATAPLPPPAAAPTRPLAQDPGATMPALPMVPTAADEDIEEAGPDEVRPALGEDDAKRQSTAVIRLDQIESNRRREVTELDPADAPRLVVLTTELAGREFSCARTEQRVGRTDENEIPIDHRSLSRTHCKIVRENTGEWRVIDLQSANGVLVNGEQYAQVALRSGDVIELGHVKLKFLMPGDSSPSGVTATSQTAVGLLGSSKGPILAIVATVLVLALGVGGYAALKGKDDGEPVKPPKPPKAVVKPPPDHPDTPQPPPEVSKEELARRLTAARAAIASLEWAKAEGILGECKLGDKVHPEARQLLNQMDGERGFKAALERAEKALDQGDEKAAKKDLDVGAGTRLLKDRYEALEVRRGKLVKEKLLQQPAPPPVQPAVAKGNAEVQRLLDEAREQGKAKQYSAVIARMERCLKLDARAFACHKLMGSAYARRGKQNNNNADVDAGLKHYETFLALAPPDDPDVPKVRKMVEEYKEAQKGVP